MPVEALRQVVKRLDEEVKESIYAKQIHRELREVNLDDDISSHSY